MPRSKLSLAVGTLALVAACAPAGAQEVNPLVRERINVNAVESRGSQVRVQTNINLFMPGPSGEGDAAAQLRDRARRAIYEMASRECALVEDVLARTCRLEAINVKSTSTGSRRAHWAKATRWAATSP